MMLMKTVCAIALLGAAVLAAHGQSTTVSVSAAPLERDVMYNGLPLPNGNSVQVGYFNNGFDVVGNAANVPMLAAAWHAIGSTDISTIFGEPGRFADNLTTSDPLFSNQKICLWIFKTSNNGDPVAAAYANVLGYGLYSGSAANWLFPAFGAVPPANMTSVSSSQVDQAYFGTFSPSHLILNPVPEPSTFALLVATGGSLVWFLRKGKKA
jgi:hypothetical protein